MTSLVSFTFIPTQNPLHTVPIIATLAFLSNDWLLHHTLKKVLALRITGIYMNHPNNILSYFCTICFDTVELVNQDA